MFPLHLLLSPQSKLPEALGFPTQISAKPATARLSRPAPEQTGARKHRPAAWALTWLGPETAIIPPAGMNVPEMGR
jgi:hypothetical protein